MGNSGSSSSKGRERKVGNGELWELLFPGKGKERKNGKLWELLFPGKGKERKGKWESGNSGSSSSYAGTALKVGALVAAAGVAAWALGVFSDSKNKDDQRPKYSPAPDADQRKKYSPAPADADQRKKYSPAPANDDQRKKYSPAPDADQRKKYSPANDDQRKKYFPAPDADQRKKYSPESKTPEEYAVKQVKMTPPDPHQPAGKIKLMCYNIWNVEVKLHERMEAIGKLIQKHSPDIILLQEVTPFIYTIFHDCNWWGLYKCSVTPEKATRKFFCMILSKLPVRESRYIHFENSNEGKRLSVTWINVGEKKLVVATCHLKRSTTSDITNSTERVAQAKEALSILEDLDSEPNVVLGGDMNWDEDSDGHFPLLGEWYDAWSILRPRENGWTYDTNSNWMLKYSRLVQKRLDRFLCKLKDFKTVSIDMIGTEAIQQIWYWSNRQHLPVLPSDHYGLILTLCLK